MEKSVCRIVENISEYVRNWGSIREWKVKFFHVNYSR